MLNPGLSADDPDPTLPPRRKAAVSLSDVKTARILFMISSHPQILFVSGRAGVRL
jgi:hypothetical protein